MLDCILDLIMVVIGDALVLLKWIVIAIAMVGGPVVIIGGIAFAVDMIRADFGKSETEMERPADPEVEYEPWIAER